MAAQTVTWTRADRVRIEPFGYPLFATRVHWHFKAPGSVAAADTMSIAAMPPEAIPLGGVWNADALASGAVVQFGDGSDVDAYQTDPAADTLSGEVFSTRALGRGLALAAATVFTLTWKAASAGMAAGDVIEGYFDYLERH